MSQRKDQRSPTDVDLDAYNQALYLTKTTMRICKTKEKNVNNHHIKKKHIPIANIVLSDVVRIGALLLNANNKYVGPRANLETRIKNYNKRIEMQEEACGLTFEVEHIIHALHEEEPFAESTLHDWIGALVRTRDAIKSWAVSDNRELKKLMGQVL